jgi:hypothetical protein
MSSRFVTTAKDEYYKDTTVVLLCAGDFIKKTINTQLGELKLAFGENVDLVVVLGIRIEEMVAALTHRVRIVENVAYPTTSVAKSALMGIRASLSENICMVYGNAEFSHRWIPPQRTGSYMITARYKPKTIGIVTEGDLIKSLAYDLIDFPSWSELIFLTKDDVNRFKKFYTNAAVMHEIINHMIIDGSIIHNVFRGE